MKKIFRLFKTTERDYLIQTDNILRTHNGSYITNSIYQNRTIGTIEQTL